MREVLVKIIEMLKEALKGLDKESNPPATHFRNERVLSFASKEVGVKEVRGSGNNARVVTYHAYARKDNDRAKAQPDSTPWCASFVCYCLEMVGMGSTNSMMARSFLKWGVSSKAKPLPGDIVVYWRGSKAGWQGHVGFFLEERGGYIYTLGGNQADSVNVSKYSKNKLLDIRRSSKQRKLSEVEEDLLWSMSGKILAGNKVELGGKLI